MRHLCLSAILASIFVAAGGCSSPAPAGVTGAVDGGSDAATIDAAPAPSPIPVRFETYNVGLAGPFIPNEVARKAGLLTALAAYDTDVLCIQEAWNQSDKVAIAAAGARGALKHSAFTQHTLLTPLTDGRDANGAVPPAYTTPPCSGAAAQSLNDGLDCLKTNCSTIPGSMAGTATSTACAKDKCVASAAALLLADDKRCYGCFAAILPSSTFAEMKAECTENVQGGLFAKGQNGVMILSRYPLKGVEEIVMPGTWIRRNVLKATATLPNGADVDTYCTHMTAYFSDTFFFPYTGQYGAGEANGWIAEQELQAKQVVAFVKAKSGTKRAVFMGDVNATREDKPHGIGDAKVPSYGAVTLATFEAAFTEAVAPNYVPSCTFCSGNQNTDGDENSWLDHIYLSQFPAASTVSTKRVFDQDAVDGMRRDATNKHTVAGKVPLSDHYGLQSTVTVAP